MWGVEMYYKYGITFKSGDSQMVYSQYAIDDFIKHLSSSKWVALNYCIPNEWNTPRLETVRFQNIIVSIDSIESISVNPEEV